MKSKYSLVTTAFLTCIAVSNSNAALYNLANGDFETPALIQNQGQAAYTGTPVLAGFAWQITSGDVDVIRALWQSASGAQSLDLNGDHQGGIYQDFSFTVGGPWAVTFAMSANPDSANVKSLNVSFGPAGGLLTSLGDFHVTPGTRTYQNMQWITFTTPAVNVQASQLYRMQFTSLNPLSSYGPALDNVQLIQVPEPGALSLLGVALAGLASRRVWKKKIQ